jgi:hypothetical protein
MERVALAKLVNSEIRSLADRLAIADEGAKPFAWLCACGCFTIVHATLDEYDANEGYLYAAGHPFGKERAAATEAFRHEPDPASLTRRIDQRKRRELTRDLARRLERQVMKNGAT